MITIKLDPLDALQAANTLRSRAREHREKHQNGIIEEMCARLERVADALDPPRPFNPVIYKHIGGNE